jgi:hypothetical protein
MQSFSGFRLQLQYRDDKPGVGRSVEARGNANVERDARRADRTNGSLSPYSQKSLETCLQTWDRGDDGMPSIYTAKP